MLNDERLLRLVGDIYDAAIEPGRWPEVVCAIGDAMRATTPGIGISDFKTGAFAFVAPRTDPDRQRIYQEYWAPRNILWQRSATLPVGEMFRFENFLPREVFDRSDMYNEWFRPQGMDVALTGNILMEGTASGVVSFFRPWKYGQFGVEEERLLAALLPHLQRAMQLHIRLGRLAMQRDSSAAMLDRFEHGALLVDAQARVLFANRGAAEMLTEPGGLRSFDGRLAAPRSAETTQLRKLIAESATEGTGGTVVIRRDERAPVIVQILPLKVRTEWLVHDQPCAIVFARDMERGATGSLQAFQQHFGLTPMQTALAREILKGDGVPAAATRLGISYATARTHLLHLFQRTGTGRQTELIGLIRDWSEGFRSG
jgi:DNA-binding CsgD family transcriptional regulator